MPAPLREIRINPSFEEQFRANLREVGFRGGSNYPLNAVPVILDECVSFGEIKKVFAGDKG